MLDSGRAYTGGNEMPALLVDLDVMERNMETMAQFVCNRQAKLRPYFQELPRAGTGGSAS